MLNIVVSTGLSTRLRGLAPDGCKSLTPLAGRTVLEHQMDVLGDVTVVCRSAHEHMLRPYARTVVDDSLCGSAVAVSKALEGVTGPVVVAYADTLFDAIPSGSDWVGVSTGQGGRKWYAIRDGHVEYEHVPEGWTAVVGVGLFAFSDPQRLKRIIDSRWNRMARFGEPLTMAPILNDYKPWMAERIESWRDVGTLDAVASYERAMA